MEPGKRRMLTVVTVAVTGLLVLIVALQAVYIGVLKGRLRQEDQGDGAQKNPPRRSLVTPPGSPRLQNPLDPGAWNPFQEMERMQERMNSMFDDAFGRFGQSPRFKGFMRGRSYSPQIDVTEEDDEYVVRVDMPGTEHPSIKAEVHGNVLTISGTRDESVREDRDDGTSFRFERRLGSFSRSVTLPGPVDAGRMTTDYKEGVLTIRLPRAGREKTRT
jgi:HSP20 family protein